MNKKGISKSNKLKIIVITILLGIITISGVTYAYFTTQITGNGEASSINIVAADLGLIYTDIQVKSGSNAEPGWSETKTLTVENIGTDLVYYNIIWRDLYNELINDELVISATCVSSLGSCSNIPRTAVPTETTETSNILVASSIPIDVGETHTYTVTITFLDTGSLQDYNQNKEFYGTLNIGGGTSVTSISLTTDQGTIGTIDRGDVVTMSTTGFVRGQQVSIEGEDFYVVNSDSSTTTLLAKYNLYVGNIYDRDGSALTYNRTLSISDEGYGLQSDEAIGCTTDECVAIVPFSGTNYWDGNRCEWTSASVNPSCTGNSGLISQYATNGASYNGNPYPNVYNSTMSTVGEVLNYEDGYGTAQNNGYTIAYYIEEYVKALGINGTGRLLTYEEVVALQNSNSAFLANNTIYWIGSARAGARVWYVNRTGAFGSSNPPFSLSVGVRPVIVIPTSNIEAN